MAVYNPNTKSISLNDLGIKNATIRYQLSSDELHEETLQKNQGRETSLGAITVETGEFTGRSPKDRFIVKDDITKDKVWWSDVNVAFDSDKCHLLYAIIYYLSLSMPDNITDKGVKWGRCCCWRGECYSS